MNSLAYSFNFQQSVALRFHQPEIVLYLIVIGEEIQIYSSVVNPDTAEVNCQFQQSIKTDKKLFPFLIFFFLNGIHLPDNLIGQFTLTIDVWLAFPLNQLFNLHFVLK